MKLLPMIEENVNGCFVDDIVSALTDGEIVVLPTDSLYALACDVLNNQAIERICKLKDMKSAKTNLSMACSDISMASRYAKIDNDLFRVIKRNEDGAFTFLVEASNRLPRAFKSRKVVGVRIVKNKILREIISRLEHPVFTTSVSGADEDYLCEPELIAQTYENEVRYVVDAGRGGATGSTVVDCTVAGEVTIVRQGAAVFEE